MIPLMVLCPYHLDEFFTFTLEQSVNGCQRVCLLYYTKILEILSDQVLVANNSSLNAFENGQRPYTIIFKRSQKKCV